MRQEFVLVGETRCPRGAMTLSGQAVGGAMPERGLLVVNADDWGGFREGTDAIESLLCDRSGQLDDRDGSHGRLRARGRARARA